MEWRRHGFYEFRVADGESDRHYPHTQQVRRLDRKARLRPMQVPQDQGMSGPEKKETPTTAPFRRLLASALGGN